MLELTINQVKELIKRNNFYYNGTKVTVEKIYMEDDNGFEDSETTESSWHDFIVYPEEVRSETAPEYNNYFHNYEKGYGDNFGIDLTEVDSAYYNAGMVYLVGCKNVYIEGQYIQSANFVCTDITVLKHEAIIDGGEPIPDEIFVKIIPEDKTARGIFTEISW